MKMSLTPAITTRAASPNPPAPAPGPSADMDRKLDVDEKLDLAAVTLSSKIPDFWSDQPRVWFIRTEAILAPQKMGDEAKFNIVVSKLGKEAIQQEILETTRPAHLAEVAQASSTSSNDRILAEIARINYRLDNLDRSRSIQRTANNFTRNRSASASRARSTSEQRRTPKSPDWLCFYHFWFQGRARKCNQPCTWKQQENGGTSAVSGGCLHHLARPPPMRDRLQKWSTFLSRHGGDEYFRDSSR